VTRPNPATPADPAEAGEAPSALQRKQSALERILRDLGSVLVAYSGGVDSTFLAAAAHRTLGPRALAVTAASPTYPSSEVEEARSIARSLGLRHLVIETDELENPAFVRNDRSRCYYCKGELFAKLWDIARQEGLAAVADGSNADDVEDYRPGRQAGVELSVRSPLLEAGLTKLEIRELSRQWGLPTWKKPSFACLSSRFPYGTSITLDALERIERAEEYLKSLGLGQLRVRHHDPIARIEVEPESFGLFLDPEVRRRVVRHLRDLGYSYVTLDLEGYRTGSLNEPYQGQ